MLFRKLAVKDICLCYIVKFPSYNNKKTCTVTAVLLIRVKFSNFYLLIGWKIKSYFANSENFWPFGLHKGHKAKKGQKGQKNKYGSKCLELSNSARNAKIAKKFQKVPKAWRSMDISPNGLLTFDQKPRGL